MLKSCLFALALLAGSASPTSFRQVSRGSCHRVTRRIRRAPRRKASWASSRSSPASTSRSPLGSRGRVPPRGHAHPVVGRARRHAGAGLQGAARIRNPAQDPQGRRSRRAQDRRCPRGEEISVGVRASPRRSPTNMSAPATVPTKSNTSCQYYGLHGRRGHHQAVRAEGVGRGVGRRMRRLGRPSRCRDRQSVHGRHRQVAALELLSDGDRHQPRPGRQGHTARSRTPASRRAESGRAVRARRTGSAPKSPRSNRRARCRRKSRM